MDSKIVEVLELKHIISKLNDIPNIPECKPDCWDKKPDVWSDWTMEEKKQLLDLYLLISKKESHIFDLIYTFHGCDSWEDMFRDYDIFQMEEKAEGVKVAIAGLGERK